MKEIPCKEVMFVTIACLLFDSIAAFLCNIHCTKMIVSGSDALAISIISNFQSIKTFQCTILTPVIHCINRYAVELGTVKIR